MRNENICSNDQVEIDEAIRSENPFGSSNNKFPIRFNIPKKKLNFTDNYEKTSYETF